MKTELNELKEELDKTKMVLTSNTITNNTTNNTLNSNNILNSNSNNTHNNIININNVGNETIKHLDYNYYENLLQGVYGAVPKLVEKIHFDDKYPENKNIKLTNKRDPYIKICKDNKWKLADRKIEVLDLIDSKCFLLRTKYNKILEMANNLTEEQQDIVNSFIKKYDEDNKVLMDDLIIKTEMMLLNNSK